MNATPDVLQVSFAQNPAMQEYLAGKNPGDVCEGRFKLRLKEADEKGARFTVDALIPDGYQEAKATDEVRDYPAASPQPSPNNGIPTLDAGTVRKMA